MYGQGKTVMHARNVFFQTRDDKAGVRESKRFFFCVWGSNKLRFGMHECVCQVVCLAVSDL